MDQDRKNKTTLIRQLCWGFINSTKHNKSKFILSTWASGLLSLPSIKFSFLSLDHQNVQYDSTNAPQKALNYQVFLYSPTNRYSHTAPPKSIQPLFAP